MAKYRIKKTEVTDGLGKTSVTYSIERKILFFWVKANFYYAKCHAVKNACFEEIDVDSCVFNTIEECQKILAHLQDNYSVKYMGNKIERILNYSLDPIFVNWSTKYKATGRFKSGTRCEVSSDLEALQRSIAARKLTTTTKTSIVPCPANTPSPKE